LNSWAIREGKQIIRTKVHVFDELLYGNSVNKSNMPTFVSNPPTQDKSVEIRAVGNNVLPQPVIADLPSADRVTGIPQFEVGGGGLWTGAACHSGIRNTL
jgi:hypothetical protein